MRPTRRTTTKIEPEEEEMPSIDQPRRSSRASGSRLVPSALENDEDDEASLTHNC